MCRRITRRQNWRRASRCAWTAAWPNTWTFTRGWDASWRSSPSRMRTWWGKQLWGADRDADKGNKVERCGGLQGYGVGLACLVSPRWETCVLMSGWVLLGEKKVKLQLRLRPLPRWRMRHRMGLEESPEHSVERQHEDDSGPPASLDVSDQFYVQLGPAPQEVTWKLTAKEKVLGHVILFIILCACF